MATMIRTRISKVLPFLFWATAVLLTAPKHVLAGKRRVTLPALVSYHPGGRPSVPPVRTGDETES